MDTRHPHFKRSPDGSCHATQGLCASVVSKTPGVEIEVRQLWTAIGTNVAKVLRTSAFLVMLLFIAAALLRWLWNITVPDVFNLNAITFWQCFRLLIIVKIVLAGGGGIMRAM